MTRSQTEVKYKTDKCQLNIKAQSALEISEKIKIKWGGAIH